ncbi:ATP-binding protein [Streptomyces scopuliridis]|uniref:ATP-binding protein n=1 Tax=Streptomyces scopuliridis TaxID=452529 RepID=UPI002DDB156C|nr:ATP-binding protein [Streptomyces scopuliridis]WSB34459.1 ATP-binding protein [Streptomyces scopuliridis]
MPENEFTPVSATGGVTRGVPDGAHPGSVPQDGAPPFALHAPPRFTQCPPPLPALGEPRPGNLDYGLTLPAALATPSIARELAELVLDVHDVDHLIDPALVLVRELVAYACRFTGDGGNVHFALRHREETLRVTVHDTHARHAHPRLADACEERRRAALERTPALVAAHRGTWGFGAADCPAAGTWTWATLVHTPRSWAA